MASLDISLDDRIKNRSSRGRGRGRGHGRASSGRGPSRTFNGGRMTGAANGPRMTGAARRGPLVLSARPSSYAIAKSIRGTRPFPWQRTDLFEESLRAVGIPGIEVGTKLYVSNLDHGVTNEDIRELFSELGDLKRYAVHYDKNGRPSGSAEVVYTRRSDAFAALKRYNNVLLDGKPMKIEIVGADAELPITARVNVTGVSGRRKRTVVLTPRSSQAVGPAAVPNRGLGWGRRGGPKIWSGGPKIWSGGPKIWSGGPKIWSGGPKIWSGGPKIWSGGPKIGSGGPRNWSASGRGRGGGRGRGRSGGRGRGKKDAGEKSAEQLDKELETYHAEAMNIS